MFMPVVTIMLPVRISAPLHKALRLSKDRTIADESLIEPDFTERESKKLASSVAVPIGTQAALI